MFKPAPLVAVGVVALLLVSPFAIGSFIESGLREQIAIYDENPSLSATVDSYERGWFDGTARISFGLSDTFLTQMQAFDPNSPAAALIGGSRIPVVVELSHGPILLDGGFGIGTATVRAYVDPESPMVAIAENFLGLPYLFELRGRSGFGTGFRFEGEIPAAENAFEDLSYAFTGLEFSGTIRNGDFDMSAATDSLSVQSPFFSAILESLALEYDYDYRADRIPLADAELSIGRLAATNPLLGAEPIFATEDLGIVWTSDENDAGTHIDARVVYSAGSLIVANELAVSDTAIGISASHLDANALLQLQEIASRLPPGATEVDMGELFMPILDQLIAGEPNISIEPARFTMSGGDFDGRASVSIDASVLPTGSFAELMNPLFAMLAVSAEIDMNVSKSLARYLLGLTMGQQFGAQMEPAQLEAMADAQFTGLVAQGLLVDDGDRYSTSIQYSAGAATANGQPIPLGAF